MSDWQPRGIKGLEGREPIGAVLSLGVKGPSGNPIQTEFFHLLLPQPVQEKRNGRKVLVRHHHPWFAPFNNSEPDKRKTVIGQIVHTTQAECYRYHLKAQRAPGKPTHPMLRPFCVGDGVQAERYMGLVEGKHRFDSIACPNRRCEYQQRPRTQSGLGPAVCKPWGKLLFRIGWRAGTMPTMLVKWTTGGWNSVKNALGLFEEIEREASMVLGGRPLNLGGFMFTMTVGQKTNPEEGSKFPVVTFAPLSDPIDFFMAQVDRNKRLESAYGLPALPEPEATVSLLDETPEDDSRDYLSHMPGVVE